MTTIEQAREIIKELAGGDAAAFWTGNPAADITDEGDVIVGRTANDVGTYLPDESLVEFAEWLLTA